MKNEITDLRPYLVKVLYPNSKKTNGTGFFCHREGYILTCHHVISPILKLKGQKKEVEIAYQNCTYPAQICNELSCLEGDIAVLKLPKPPKAFSVLPIDAYSRIREGKLQSFGYPRGPFEIDGIPITGTVGGLTPTRVENVEVFPIAGLNMDNVDYGYSGAPIIHQRIQKVIGIIYAKHKATQAFFVPIEKLFQSWPELRDINDVYQRIRKRFATDAQEKFKNNLKDSVFIPLNLEFGIIPEKKADKREIEKEAYGHGRKWEQFDLKRLFHLRGKYVLSSDVGTGKTTFLYWMANEIVKETVETVSLLMDCAEAERYNLKNWDDLLNELVHKYKNHFLEADLEDFLKNSFEEKKLLFLFDGLDQIREKNYSNFTNFLLKIGSKNSVVISSRPSAVLALENKAEIIFLRLKSFTSANQKLYFHEKYGEAVRLSSFAPDLIKIPMLAFMVKTLIRDKKTRNVLTRTDIYTKFLTYIFSKHEPHFQIARQQIGLRKKIEESLKRISFEAINQERPQIQKIDVDLYYDKLDHAMHVEVEQLATFGLVNLIIEKSEKPFIFFTHQSFQEFLAAHYLSEHEELIEKINRELSISKWKEVFKFLVGLRGQEIIEKILSQDNVIHSGLFLAAECLPETNRVNEAIKGKIALELQEVSNLEPFRRDATRCLGFVNELKQLQGLLKDIDMNIRKVAIETLHTFASNLDAESIASIMPLLHDKYWDVREAARKAITDVQDKLDETQIQKMRDWFLDPDYGGRGLAIESLTVFENRLDDSDVSRFAQLLEAAETERLAHGIWSMAMLEEHGNEQHISRIIDLLLHRDEYSTVFRAASRVLRRIKHRVSGKDIRKINTWLKQSDSDVRKRALMVLEEVPEWLDKKSIPIVISLMKTDDFCAYRPEVVVKVLNGKLEEKDIDQIFDLLKNPNAHARAAAVKVLAALRESIKRRSTAHRIAEHMTDSDWFVRACAIEAVVYFEDEVTGDNMRRIIELMGGQEDRSLQFQAQKALVALHEKIGEKEVRKISDLMHDDRPLQRMLAIKVLSSVSRLVAEKDISTIVELLTDCEGHPDQVRWAASDALGELYTRMSDQDYCKIVNWLDAADRDLRIISLQTLSKLKGRVDRKCISTVAGLLSDEDKNVRRFAVKAMATFCELVDLKDLTGIIELLRDRVDDVRMETVEALAAFVDLIESNHIGKIADWLEDKDDNISYAALKALKVLHSRADNYVVRKLIKVLKNAKEARRGEALDVLRLICESGKPSAHLGLADSQVR